MMAPSQSTVRREIVADLEIFRKACENPSDAKVLERILDSRPAADSFARVTGNTRQRILLITDCIKAKKLARDHKEIIERSQRRLERAGMAKKALKIVADFLDKEIQTEIAREARKTIADLLDLAEANDRRILAEFQRKKDLRAARSSGIAWIKDSVRRLSGEAHLEEVRTIAEVVLDMGELSLHAVRKAVSWEDRIRKHIPSNKSVERVRGRKIVRKAHRSR